MRMERLLRDLLAQLFGTPVEQPAPQPRAKAKEPTVEQRIETTEVAADRNEELRQALAASPITAVEEKKPMRPAFDVVAWSVPKPGNRPDQNQDAFASEEKEGRLRLSMSDGVSDESFDSRGWAAALCLGFLDRPAGAIKATWLETKLQAIATSFLGKVEERVANVDTKKAYSWMAKPRAEKGSKATLLCLELGPTGRNRAAHWKAFGVGDTNLFVVRDGAKIRAWPLESSREFGELSDAASTKAVSETQWRLDGKGWARKGDQIYVMTDALAQYVLRREEAGDPVWRQLAKLDGEAAFAAFVEQARADGMTPDDTTLQRIVVPGRGG